MAVLVPPRNPSAERAIQRGRAARSGFTLAELIAASVLGVMLLAALTGLLRSIGRQDRLARAVSGDRAWTEALAEQLRVDCANARQIIPIAGGIRLLGYLARDGGVQTATLRPAQVVYRVGGDARQRWLVREQYPVDEPGGRLRRVDLVAVGVARMEVVVLDDQVPAAMPKRLLVTVRGEDGRPLMSTWILHHMELL